MHKLLCIWAGPYFADMIAVIIGESGLKIPNEISRLPTRARSDTFEVIPSKTYWARRLITYAREKLLAYNQSTKLCFETWLITYVREKLLSSDYSTMQIRCNIDPFTCKLGHILAGLWIYG